MLGFSEHTHLIFTCYSFVTLVICCQWYNAAVRTFKELYACLMHVGYVLQRAAMGKTLGTEELCRHFLAWLDEHANSAVRMAKQTAPSSMANQYRDEMKYGF
jgi:hypothetical protein